MPQVRTPHHHGRQRTEGRAPKAARNVAAGLRVLPRKPTQGKHQSHHHTLLRHQQPTAPAPERTVQPRALLRATDAAAAAAGAAEAAASAVESRQRTIPLRGSLRWVVCVCAACVDSVCTENLLEGTGGLLRLTPNVPTGGRSNPLGEAACCSRFLLTCSS